MVALRWMLFLLAAECLAALFLLPRGEGTAVLAALFFILFIALCATFGAFTPHTESEITE